jgi:sensor histidine kinase YesM
VIRLLRGFRHDAIQNSGFDTGFAGVPDGWERLPASKRWKSLLAINLVAVIVSALLIIAVYRLQRPFDIFLALFYSMICANIMGYLITMSLIRFGRRLYFQPFPLNWTLIVGMILACTIAGSLAANLLFLTLGLLPSNGFWASFRLVTEFATAIALVFGITGFAYEIFRTTLEMAAVEVRSAQLEEERARKYALEAQLASLESHIRPHFLFNTLNTISSLIQDDPALAESLVGKLASLLRFSLDSNRRNVVPLGSEMELVSQYLEIERARLGDRLTYEIDVSRGMEGTAVPLFSLQTLAENSIKYAVANRLVGGSIRIVCRAENGAVLLEVHDSGAGFTADAIRPGHGLHNLQGRLAALFGSEAKLEIAGNNQHAVVRVRFPQIQAE